MEAYRRTRLAHLRIRGYRSIADLSLGPIPDLVVMHGPNGAGKSNILRAVRLALRAVGVEGGLAASRDDATPAYEKGEAEVALGIGPFDFRQGSAEIRIGLGIELGDRAHLAIDGSLSALETVTLELVLQSIGGGRIKAWFDDARTDRGLSLFDSSGAGPVRAAIRDLEGKLSLHREEINASRSEPVAEFPRPIRPSVSQNLRVLERAADQEEKQIAALRAQLSAEDLRAERTRSFLASSLIQASEAYRRVEDQEAALFEAMVSADRARVDAAKRLQGRLTTAGLFGGAAVELRPVQGPIAPQIFVGLATGKVWLRPMRGKAA